MLNMYKSKRKYLNNIPNREVKNMKQIKISKYRDLLLGLLMYLLLLPEFVLFVTVGTENILKSYIGVASFFVFSILLYTAVPLLVERKIPIESKKEFNIKANIWSVVLASSFIILKMFIQKQGMPKFISEYSNFIQASGFIGVIGASLQHLYYFAEMVLCCYMLRAFQKAGENLLRYKNIPYGGIVLGLLWGLIVHTISKDFSVGLYMLIMSVVWGTIYLVSKKNRWLTYFLMTIMFIT